MRPVQQEDITVMDVCRMRIVYAFDENKRNSQAICTCVCAVNVDYTCWATSGAKKYNLKIKVRGST